MNNYITELEKKLDNISLRERFLILGAALLLIYQLFNFLWFSSIDRESLKSQQESQHILSEINLKKIESQTLTQLMKAGKNSNQSLELAELEKDVTESEQKLGELTNGITPPSQLISLLHSVLEPTSSLNLLQVKADNPRKIIDAVEGEMSTGIYRQDFTVLLQGSFMDTLRYIRGLQGSEWGLHWSQLHYLVEEKDLGPKPIGTAQLYFYTLTSAAGLYGESREK